MFKALWSLFKPQLVPVNTYNENNGAGIDLQFIPGKDCLIFIKGCGQLTVALTLELHPSGHVTDAFVYRLHGGWRTFKESDVRSGIRACQLLYDADTPVHFGGCPVIKKEPRNIYLKGTKLVAGDVVVDLTNPFADYMKLKQLFWTLSIPFMGPSTLLQPLQEEYVRTLYDIAQTGKKQEAHHDYIVKFLEQHNYIQRQPGGEFTITQRAGKVFKTAMAANDMRTATLRLSQCMDYDVWPYHF